MHLPDQILRTFRALRRLGLVDLRGYLSARIPNNEVMITPSSGFAVPPPVLLTGDDLVRVNPNGHRLAGRWSPPRDVELHLQIYRTHPDFRAPCPRQSWIAWMLKNRPQKRGGGIT